MNTKKAINVNKLTVGIIGDSGDGIQLIGSYLAQGANAISIDVNTSPSFPAEIRAPAGTLAGVSGFQLQLAKTKQFTPGDRFNILIAMNPAALKQGMKNLAASSLIIINSDSFHEKELTKAGYQNNPLTSGELVPYQCLEIPITTLSLHAVKDIGLAHQQAAKCKNMLAMGILAWMLSLEEVSLKELIRSKFGKKSEQLAQANLKAFNAGYNFAETSEIFYEKYSFPSAHVTKKEKVIQINGNEAIALACLIATQQYQRSLFLSGYPITPASSVLHYLSRFDLAELKVLQTEDEISAVCSSIGAAYGGSLAVTVTSGPGFDLKAEGIGLAVMTELPIVVIDIQRAGPSTGMPTKPEQSDLLAAIYGRHGECPVPVMAAATPSNCYQTLLEAFRIATKYMTPVIFLSDAYLANASECWVPDISYEHINTASQANFTAFQRDPATLAPAWLVPGIKDKEYQMGGLEKDYVTGQISYETTNHQKMVNIRRKKIELIAEEQVFNLQGAQSGELLVLSWGSTFGSVHSAISELQASHKGLSHLHLTYLYPIAKTLADVFKRFKKILIPELNNGQLAKIIRENFLIDVVQYNKITGQPFTVTELVDFFTQQLTLQ